MKMIILVGIWYLTCGSYCAFIKYVGPLVLLDITILLGVPGEPLRLYYSVNSCRTLNELFCCIIVVKVS